MFALLSHLPPSALEAVLGSHLVLAQVQNTGSNIQNSILGIVRPLFLTIVVVGAIFFLLSKQFSQFGQFLVAAIVIGALLFNPGLIQTFASWAGGLVG